MQVPDNDPPDVAPATSLPEQREHPPEQRENSGLRRSDRDRRAPVRFAFDAQHGYLAVQAMTTR
jgi:hypothetical protein